jgi:hypothetical protein
LTSYDYVAEVFTMDELRSFVDYANGDANDPEQGLLPNMGMLTGPEEYADTGRIVVVVGWDGL